MSQEERTQLIREIKELLKMHYKYGKSQNIKVFKNETILALENLLLKMVNLSLI